MIVERWRTSVDAQPVALASTATCVAIGLDDGRVVHVGVVDGRQRALLRVHDDGLLCLAASEDGRLIASGGADGRLVISTVEGALVSARCREWVDRVAWASRTTVFGAAGTELVRLALDGRADMRDLGRGVMALATSSPRASGVVAVAVTGSLLLLDAADLTRVEEHRVPGTGRSLAAHPLGAGWAMGTQEQSLVCLRMDDRYLSRLDGYVRPVRDLAFSPDGASIATSGMNLLVVWALPRLDCHEADASLIETDGEPVSFARFHPSGEGIAVVNKRGDLFTLDARSRTRQRYALGAPPIAISFDPTGALLTCATADGSVRAFSWLAEAGRDATVVETS